VSQTDPATAAASLQLTGVSGAGEGKDPNPIREQQERAIGAAHKV